MKEEAVAKESTPSLHLVAQGKGGAGKTFISSLLCQQYLREKVEYAAFDLDPVNRSFAAIPGLNAKPWTLLNSNADIDPVKFDDLVEVIFHSKCDVVLDLGATSFLPFNNYLSRNCIFELLRKEANIKVIIHCVIRGGSSLLECLNGLNKLCVHHSQEDAEIVVWLNEVEGEIARGGKHFKEMKIYKEMKSRIARVVVIPELKDYLHRNDMLELLKNNQRFDDAIESKQTGIVSKIRIKNLKKTFCDVAKDAIGVNQ